MGIIYTLHFPNTEDKKSKKGPLNLGSWVNSPPVLCQQSKYLITKVHLTLPKGQPFCDSSIETDPLGAWSKFPIFW